MADDFVVPNEKFGQMPITAIELGLALGKWQGEERKVALAVVASRKEKKSRSSRSQPKASWKLIAVVTWCVLIVVSLLAWFFVLTNRW